MKPVICSKAIGIYSKKHSLDFSIEAVQKRSICNELSMFEQTIYAGGILLLIRLPLRLRLRQPLLYVSLHKTKFQQRNTLNLLAFIRYPLRMRGERRKVELWVSSYIPNIFFQLKRQTEHLSQKRVNRKKKKLPAKF